MQSSATDFKAVLTSLAGHDVDFVLIGGLAMNAHGSAYITVDIDIFYARDRANIRRIADALSQFEPRPRGFEPSLPFIWDHAAIGNSSLLTLDTRVGKVDLLSEVSGATSFDSVKQAASIMPLYGMEISVVSLDDLIAMKKAANRAKDLPHIMELEAIRKMTEAADS